MHLQECFAHLGYGVGSLPENECAAKETMAIPVYPELSEEQARHVVDSIRDFLLTHNAARGVHPTELAEPRHRA